MDRVRARTVAFEGDPIPADHISGWGYPFLLDVINDCWQKTGRGVTLEVLLDFQDTETAERQLWREIGARLCARLLLLGKWYGLYLNTPDLPFDTVLGWMRAATANGARAAVDLTLVCRPHVARFEETVEEVRCCLFQSRSFDAWLDVVWSDTGPGNFFFRASSSRCTPRM